MIRVYALGAACAAFLGLAGALWWQTGRLDHARAENAALRASVAAMAMERDLAREAEAVADAYRRASETKAREYDHLREGILRDGEDADLPDWLLDVLVGLRSGPDRETGGAAHPR